VGAQLEASDIQMFTNKKYYCVESAYDVQCMIETMSYTAGFFGGMDCVLAKELMGFQAHISTHNWKTYNDLIIQQPTLGNMILSAINQGIQVYLKALMESTDDSLNPHAHTSLVTSFCTHQADMEQRHFLMTLPTFIAQYMSEDKKWDRPQDAKTPSTPSSDQNHDPKNIFGGNLSFLFINGEVCFGLIC
jgi:hypothetical protein